MKFLELQSRSAEETAAMGEALGRCLGDEGTILLSGDLGAGKTCFTQGLARGLEVPENEPVASPSYTLMNHYRGRVDIFHFDLYRLSSPDDLYDIGFEEQLEAPGVKVIEWSDRFLGNEQPGIRVCLSYEGENGRVLSLTAQGADYERRLEAFHRRWEDGCESKG